ncbi:uncharacterized protein LOC131663637 [Phymastichus coffea]|uniref:uncharacterized protein LOC131663637 n=1 Tax=Phymastichus coffea TaxID=108790 RepID=UPI00273BFBCF|nr:uncharacterized protein LOC131663637 [Phymastichus coffea]
MGAALEQFLDGSWKPLAFFSRKFTKAQLNYDTYDRELTRSDKASPRRRRQLCYISQFTTEIEHLSGSKNVVADCLSRVESVRLPLELNMLDLAKAQAEDTELAELRKNTDKHSLKLIFLEWGQDLHRICVDQSGTVLRPYIPKPFRKRVFDQFHLLAYGGPKVTDQCKTCLDCQALKISRHVRNNAAPFVASDGRFQHVHLDLIGELKLSQGFVYCLTMIDRFSRWTEAVPIRDKTAQTVSRAFYDNWVCRFGAPERVTTDQGSEFEAQLTKALLSFIGCERIRTTAWHPKANGMIERWHRTMKAAIMYHNDENWHAVLPTVLLGLRIHVCEETGVSRAEYVYGTVLCVPGEFFLEGEFMPDPQIFLEEFREHMRKVRPIPVTQKYRLSGSPSSVHTRVKGVPKVVSTELLKPAPFLDESNSAPLPTFLQQNTTSVQLPTNNEHITRSLLVHQLPSTASSPASQCPATNRACTPLNLATQSAALNQTSTRDLAPPQRPALKTYPSRKAQQRKTVTVNLAANEVFRIPSD